MAVVTMVPVEEYLRTNYDPDRDYIDGELVERNLGETKHGRLQGRIMAWMYAQEARLGIQAVVEVRLQVAERKYRIPDLMVLAGDAPEEPVVSTPPLLCVEVLSTCDTPQQMGKRAQDYLAIGVPVCWILDPVSGHAWEATATGLTEVRDGILRAGKIEMPLAAVL